MQRKQQKRNISCWSSLSSILFINFSLQNKSKAKQNTSLLFYCTTAVITQVFSFAFSQISILKLVSKQHKQIATLIGVIVAKSKGDLWDIQSSHLLLVLAPTAEQSRISSEVVYFSIKQNPWVHCKHHIPGTYLFRCSPVHQNQQPQMFWEAPGLFRGWWRCQHTMSCC